MAKTRSKLTDNQKKKRRREQKTLSMRKAREKLKQNPEALEEKRRKDREYYHRKKSEGKIKTVEDLPDLQKKLLRKKWREDARRRREKVKIQKEAEKFIARETPPTSPVTSASSRVEMGARIAVRNRRRLKVENDLLKKKLMSLECKLTKYRMRLHRLQNKKRKEAKETQKKKRNEGSTKVKELRDNIQQYLLSDESSRLTSGKKETITRNKQKKQIRFAAKHVAQGNDVHNLDAFMECVLQNCKGIEVNKVDETHVESIESKIKNSNITPFRGSMKVHQVTWSRRKPIVLQFRRLSCMKCSPENTCIHYGLGSKKLDIAPCPRPLQNNVSTLSSPVLTTPLQSPTRNDTPTPTERMNSSSPNLILTSMHSPVASRWSSPIASGSMQQPLKVGECSPSLLIGDNVHKRIKFSDVYSDSSDMSTSKPEEPPNPTFMSERVQRNFWSSDDEDIF